MIHKKFSQIQTKITETEIWIFCNWEGGAVLGERVACLIATDVYQSNFWNKEHIQ